MLENFTSHTASDEKRYLSPFRKRLFFIMGICMVVFCLLATVGNMTLFSVPVDEIDLKAYVLSDGSVICQVTAQDGRQVELVGRTEVTKEGKGVFYMFPERSVLDIIGISGLWDSSPGYMWVDISEISARRASDTLAGQKIVACYLGKGDNAVLVWDETTELLPAPRALEKQFTEEK